MANKRFVAFVAGAAAFEAAARSRLRFPSPIGELTVEDLYDLPLTSLSGRANLDDLAKNAQREIRSETEAQSFVEPGEGGPDPDAQLRFDLIRHVISVKVAERDAAADAHRRREEKQKILALISEKQDEALRGKSLEELQALVEAL